MPVVGGRASICTWSLSAQFLTKKQAVDAITQLMAEPIDFPVMLERGMNETHDTYTVSIEGMSWARNLKRAAEILASVDHEMEGDNDRA
jgi:hypothetical protein